MHFMFLILAFMLWAVVWGFFHANPKGVPPTWLYTSRRWPAVRRS